MRRFHENNPAGKRSFVTLTIILLLLFMIPIIDAQSNQGNVITPSQLDRIESTINATKPNLDDVMLGIKLIGGIGIVLTVLAALIIIIVSLLGKRNYIDKYTIMMGLGALITISCIYLLIYVIELQVNMQIGIIQLSKNITNTTFIGMGNGDALSVVIPVILGLLVFGAVLLMCQVHHKHRDKEVGVMRKTIAGLLVVGLVAVIFFALAGKIYNENIVTQYIQLVGVIIAFYFGSRVAGEAGGKPSSKANGCPDDVVIESADHENGKNVTIYVTNNRSSPIEIGKVAIDGILDYSPSLPMKIGAKQASWPVNVKDVITGKEIESKKYMIRVVLSDGTPVTRECEITARQK